MIPLATQQYLLLQRNRVYVLRFDVAIHMGRFGGMECGQRSQQQGGEEELEIYERPMTS